jgi:osmoprotectant transport system permease protein
MELIPEVFAWLTDPANWQGTNGIPNRTLQHVGYSASAIIGALLIALPVGLWVGHTRRGGALAINIANVGRAIPSFGIIILMVVLAGLGFLPVLVALVAFAIPPILTNTYTGIRGVDPRMRESAEGMGMRPMQVLLRVEIPVAMPLIMAGVRTSAVQVVATAAIAAFPGLGGLGRYIINGFAVQDLVQMISGAVLIALLAIAVEGLLALVQGLVVSEGIAPTDSTVVAEAKSTSIAA